MLDALISDALAPADGKGEDVQERTDGPDMPRSP